METQYPMKVTLRDGRRVELRPLQRADEERLVAFFTHLPPAAVEFLRDDVRDPAVVRRFARELNPEHVWSIVAIAEDGRIVGDATLHMFHHGWRRHLGEVRTVIAPEYQKQRLATTMLHELVNQASHRKLRKLEAVVLASQADARRAFEHLGFREEARLKDHAMDLHGRMHDMLILTNTVEDLWRTMEDMISDMEIGRESITGG